MMIFISSVIHLNYTSTRSNSLIYNIQNDFDQTESLGMFSTWNEKHAADGLFIGMLGQCTRIASSSPSSPSSPSRVGRCRHSSARRISDRRFFRSSSTNGVPATQYYHRNIHRQLSCQFWRAGCQSLDWGPLAKILSLWWWLWHLGLWHWIRSCPRFYTTASSQEQYLLFCRRFLCWW